MNGDDILNSTERRLWGLHQHIYWTWGTYCLFTHKEPHIPLQFPEFITFMVPKDATHRYEIEEYLKHELEYFAKEPVGDSEYRHPGTKVNVMVVPFSGVEPYADKDTLDRISKEAIKTFSQMFSKYKRRGEDGEAGED
jgi:hypothetical protein